MDETVIKMKTFTPKPLSELLHGQSGVLPKDSMRKLNEMQRRTNSIKITNTTQKDFESLTLGQIRSHFTSELLPKNSMRAQTEIKQPRQRIEITHTTKKNFVPLPIDQLRLHLPSGSNVNSGQTKHQPDKSVKKMGWNTSVKVNKIVNHTANGQLKNHSVRKVLNFPQPKPKIQEERKQFPKPGVKGIKSLDVKAQNNIRISGVYKIQETPTVKRHPVYRSRMTLANKENALPHNTDTKKKLPVQKKLTVPNTPLSNTSCKSNSDASFLQLEKDIEGNSSRENVIKSVDKTAQQISTPFKEYRNVQEFFNNAKGTDNSFQYNDKNKNGTREESVIVSLCNMFDKAGVNKCDKSSTEYKDFLLQIEKQTVHNIEMIKEFYEYHQEMLNFVRKLINENNTVPLTSEIKNVIEDVPESKKEVHKTNTIREYSVIKSPLKSPTYKIPRKSSCLRKKLFHKSMPNVCNGTLTPTKDTNDKAMDIYMAMKKEMNFLNTPVIKCKRAIDTQSTPAVTSQNLQMQLANLYNGS